MVVLAQPRIENGHFQHQSYVALFRVDNVDMTERGLEFDLVEELAKLD